MTADEQERNTMSERAVPPGDVGASQRTPGTGRVSLKRVAWLVLAIVVFYALALSVLSDALFLLAIPGLIGLMTLGSMGVAAVMHRELGEAVPYATDGSDSRGAVKHHRAVFLKRYAAIVVVSVALGALLPLTKSDYLVPLAPLAIAGLVFGTYTLRDQLGWLRRCSRVLGVYDLGFRAPVDKLSARGGGKRVLSFGGEGEKSPKMAGRQLAGQRWPEQIADGVWFAGDDTYGGALLVPGSGELMFLQPQDWGVSAGERSRAGAERSDRARRAGIDKHNV